MERAMKNPRITWKPRTKKQRTCSHRDTSLYWSHVDRLGRRVTTCGCGLTLARA